MSRSQFHSISRLYLDMHGLIFETSVWLLAGSTRLLSSSRKRSPAEPTEQLWPAETKPERSQGNPGQSSSPEPMQLSTLQSSSKGSKPLSLPMY